MRLSLAILSGLAASAYGWEIWAFETDKDCHVGDREDWENSRYRIYTNTEDVNERCLYFGGVNAGLACQQYNRGGLEGPVDCMRLAFDEIASLEVSGTTEVDGDDDCFKCTFYQGGGCSGDTMDVEMSSCTNVNFAPASFKCVKDSSGAC